MDTTVCPTECDADCGAFCHESHVPGHKRDHWPEDCPGHPLHAEVAAAEARGRKQAADEIAQRIEAEYPRDEWHPIASRVVADIARAYAAEQDTEH